MGLNLLIISSEDQKRAVTIIEVIDAVELALCEFSSGNTTAPARAVISIPRASGNSLFMPSYVEAAESLGIKIVSVFPGNKGKGQQTINGILALMDVGTGEIIALLEASYLTILRTGAVVGLANKYLSRNDSETLGLIGTGAQSRGLINAIQAVRPIKNIYLYNRTSSKAYDLAAELKQSLRERVSVEVVHCSDDAVKNADILVTATNSEQPVITALNMKVGVTVNAIGSFTPQMQELPTNLVLQAQKIVVESRKAALLEAGDLIIPIRQGKFEASQIYAELGEITKGIKPGRENDDELIIFKSVGLSVMDVVTAKLIYDRAEQLGLGHRITIS